MLVYVSFPYRGDWSIREAKKTLMQMQLRDKDNCFISPLTAFSHLFNVCIPFDLEIALRTDLLMACDKLIVAEGFSDDITNAEIEYAQAIGMEIEYAENRRKYR